MLTKLVRSLGYTLVVVGLSGCGDRGWVRVSPDGRYTTIVRDVKVSEEETSAELALYEFDHDAITPIAHFSTESDSRVPFVWIDNCQWTPDSRALSFLVVESEPKTVRENAPSEEADAVAIPRFRVVRTSLMLYNVASRKLLRLPIDSPTAANWSRNGKHLIVYHGGETATIALYRADTWTRVGTVAVPAEYCDHIFVWEWAVLLSDAPLSVLVLLGSSDSEGNNSPFSQIRGGNLYLLRGGRLAPFTTSGDVQAFWVDAISSVVRWARVQHRKYLAVFERPLSGGAPRRLVLSPIPRLRRTLASIALTIASPLRATNWLGTRKTSALCWTFQQELYARSLQDIRRRSEATL